MTAANAGPSVTDQQVSMELLRFRESLPRGVPAHAVARDLGWSPSKVSRYEQARTGITRGGLNDILVYYTARHGMTARHAGEIRAMHEAALTGAWLRHPYLGAAMAAPAVREWAPLFVPRLLQVPAYAEAVLTDMQPVTQASPGDIRAAVNAVTWWQRHLAARPPELLHAVLDEPVLSRPAGPPEVLAAQLEYLERADGRGPVRIRVLPAGAAGVPRWAPAFRCLDYAVQGAAMTRTETDELEGPGQPLTDDGNGAWRRQLMFRQLWNAAEPAGPFIRKMLAAAGA